MYFLVLKMLTENQISLIEDKIYNFLKFEQKYTAGLTINSIYKEKDFWYSSFSFDKVDDKAGYGSIIRNPAPLKILK